MRVFVPLFHAFYHLPIQFARTTHQHRSFKTNNLYADHILFSFSLAANLFVARICLMIVVLFSFTVERLFFVVLFCCCEYAFLNNKFTFDTTLFSSAWKKTIEIANIQLCIAIKMNSKFVVANESITIMKLSAHCLNTSIPTTKTIEINCKNNVRFYFVTIFSSF